MAETENTEETLEGEEESGGGGKKKLIIIAVAALLVLGGGGGAAAYFLGLFGGGDETQVAEGEEGAEGEGAEGGGEEQAASEKAADSSEGAEAEDPTLAVFVDLPDVLVNLQSESRRSRFLKLRVALEVGDPTAAEQVEILFPKILDSFQLYLRALSADELKGSQGMQRLKAEMLARINLAIEPIKITDLLFKEMLVQ